MSKERRRMRRKKRRKIRMMMRWRGKSDNRRRKKEGKGRFTHWKPFPHKLFKLRLGASVLPYLVSWSVCLSKRIKYGK